MSIKNYNPKARVYLDLDGVLADYIQQCIKEGVEPKKAKSMIGFFERLEVMSGAKEFVEELHQRGFDLFVLSKAPDENPYSATEKLLWVNEHFPKLVGRVFIAPDKGAVGRECDFLVDDNPQWANALAFRGKIVHFNGCFTDCLKQIPIKADRKEIQWKRSPWNKEDLLSEDTLEEEAKKGYFSIDVSPNSHDPLGALLSCKPIEAKRNLRIVEAIINELEEPLIDILKNKEIVRKIKSLEFVEFKSKDEREWVSLLNSVFAKKEQDNTKTEERENLKKNKL